MIFTYDGDDYTIPDTLADITFQEQVDWFSLYGYELAQRIAAIELITDEAAKALESALLTVDKMQKAIAYYTGIPLATVVDNIGIYDITEAYMSSALVLAVDLKPVELEEPYEWEVDTYEFNLPEDSVSDPVTADEFRAMCKLATYLREVHTGNWTNAIPLVAAFFRIEEEAFSIGLIDPDGARCVLFADLPLKFALFTIQSLNDYAQFTDILNAHAYDEIVEE